MINILWLGLSFLSVSVGIFVLVCAKIEYQKDEDRRWKRRDY